MVAVHVHAQEPFFAQFYNSPLTLNPALAGTSYGAVRTSLNYRTSLNQFDQIRTTAIAVDMSLLENDRNPDYMGVGLYIMKDKAGTFENLKSMVTVSYHKSVGRARKSYVALGIQSGLDNSRLNYQGLSTQSQWTSTGYDPTLSSGESFRYESVSVIDFQAGALWYSFLSDKSTVLFGLATFHTMPANRSFLGQSYELNQKYVAHASASFQMNSKVTALPMVMFSVQNGIAVLCPGAEFELALDKIKKVSCGAWVRNFDACTLMGGVEYAQFSATVSYDLMISSIREASTKGGIEFKMGYKFSKKLKGATRYRSNPSPRF
jgi:type IX secretion system PorP/SprF family membrane protein